LEKDPSFPIVNILQTPLFISLRSFGTFGFTPNVYDKGTVWPTKNVTKHDNNKPTKYINPFIS
jgi:hypothetical protein